MSEQTGAEALVRRLDEVPPNSEVVYRINKSRRGNRPPHDPSVDELDRIEDVRRELRCVDDLRAQLARADQAMP